MNVAIGNAPAPMVEASLQTVSRRFSLGRSNPCRYFVLEDPDSISVATEYAGRFAFQDDLLPVNVDFQESFSLICNVLRSSMGITTLPSSFSNYTS